MNIYTFTYQLCFFKELVIVPRMLSQSMMQCIYPCSFCMVFSELPFMSEPQSESQQQQQQQQTQQPQQPQQQQQSQQPQQQPQQQPSALSQPQQPPPPSAGSQPAAMAGSHNGARDPRSAAGGHRGGGWQGGRDPRSQSYGRPQQGRGRSSSDPRSKR